jgi:N-acetylmuramoyl-L-alanine amidase
MAQNPKVLLLLLAVMLFLALFPGVPVAASKTESLHSRSETTPKYVPAARVIDRFNLTVEIDAATGVFRLRSGRKTVMFVAGSREVFFGGRVSLLSAPVQLREGQLFIPRDGVDLLTTQLLNRRVSWSYEGGVFGLEREGKPEGAQTRVVRRVPESFDIDAIIIDPGHGGSDPGGVGSGGVKEKDIVLSIAQELKRELVKKHRQREIFITREQDVFVSLEDRGAVANGVNPDRNPIFISIHANASFEKKTYGFETYFLTLDPVSEEAREVAQMENSVFTPEIENYSDNIRQIMNRIVDVEYRRESMKLADFIQERLAASIGTESANRGVKSAFFYVLKAAKMPAVLVEIGFVTNSDESNRLLQPEYRRKISRGIAEGIEDFIVLFQRTEGFTKSD